MNKINKSFLLLILIGGALAFLSSCNTSRKLITHSELKKKSFSVLYNNMEKNQVKFNYLNARLAIKFQKEGKKGTNLKGWLRISNDSIIWLSIIPAFGIEVARAEVTPDSLKLINRMKKTYLLGDFHLLDSLLHTSLDYNVLQALLTGNDFNGYQMQSHSAGVDGQNYVLLIKSRKIIRKIGPFYNGEQSELIQKIWLNPDNYRLKKLDVVEKVKGHKANRIQVFYDSYQTVNGQLFPENMRVVFFSKPKAEINITFKKIVLEKELSFPFIIPNTYKKINVRP